MVNYNRLSHHSQHHIAMWKINVHPNWLELQFPRIFNLYTLSQYLILKIPVSTIITIFCYCCCAKGRAKSWQARNFAIFKMWCVETCQKGADKSARNSDGRLKLVLSDRVKERLYMSYINSNKSEWKEKKTMNVIFQWNGGLLKG